MKKFIRILILLLFLTSCSNLNNNQIDKVTKFEEENNQIIFEIINDIKLNDENDYNYQFDYKLTYQDKSVDLSSMINLSSINTIEITINDDNLIIHYPDYPYAELNNKCYNLSPIIEYFEINSNNNWSLTRNNQIYQYKLSDLLENKITVIGLLSNEETIENIEVKILFRNIYD